MTEYGYDNWFFVALNVVLFGSFVLFIPFRKKIARLSTSVYLAFIVALYAEMYGFPLTIFILSWLFGYQNPLTHTAGHIFAGLISDSIFFGFFHPLSIVMMSIGTLLVLFGWRKSFGGTGRLVTDGIYAYSRHPQYLGFLILTLGMVIQWTTILTLAMWPVLAILYYRLAKNEEKEMEGKFGEEYRQYKAKVPMFLPLKHRAR